MSDRPTSFHDFKWACGHTGPGYCKTCRDDEIERRDELIDYKERQIMKERKRRIKEEKKVDRLTAELNDAEAVHKDLWCKLDTLKEYSNGTS